MLSRMVGKADFFNNEFSNFARQQNCIVVVTICACVELDFRGRRKVARFVQPDTVWNFLISTLLARVIGSPKSTGRKQDK